MYAKYILSNIVYPSSFGWNSGTNGEKTEFITFRRRDRQFKRPTMTSWNYMGENYWQAKAQLEPNLPTVVKHNKKMHQQ